MMSMIGSIFVSIGRSKDSEAGSLWDSARPNISFIISDLRLASKDKGRSRSVAPPFCYPRLLFMQNQCDERAGDGPDYSERHTINNEHEHESPHITMQGCQPTQSPHKKNHDHSHRSQYQKSSACVLSQRLF